MSKDRIAARWVAGLLTAGMIVLGGVTPAQADPGPKDPKTHTHRLPVDTGWNGT